MKKRLIKPEIDRFENSEKFQVNHNRFFVLK